MIRDVEIYHFHENLFVALRNFFLSLNKFIKFIATQSMSEVIFIVGVKFRGKYSENLLRVVKAVKY